MPIETTLTVTINDGSGRNGYKKLSLPGKWFRTPGRCTFLLTKPLNLGPNGYVLRDHEDFSIEYGIEQQIKFDIPDDTDDVYVFEFYSDKIVKELKEQKEER